MESKLLIASAGAGKTTYIVDSALVAKGNILITTYTEANESEIRKKLIERVGCIPDNITIQTWFSFQIQHGVKPYQSYLTDKRIKGMLLVNRQSTRYCKDTDVEKYYFTSDDKLYSDKIAKFICKVNEICDNCVIERIMKIFDTIFIDEVQDLAGYDLELIKKLIESMAKVIMVGDPRQVTYLTHHERKYGKYSEGKIVDFINDTLSDKCEVDEDTLCCTYRNNKKICDYADKLYPEYSCTNSMQEDVTDHDGIFLVSTNKLDEYLEKYQPVQLRYNRKTKVKDSYPVFNYGESKGMTFDRVLIYPTKGIIKWMKDNSKELEKNTKSRLYVAITRAKYSVAFIYDKDDIDEEMISYY